MNAYKAIESLEAMQAQYEELSDRANKLLKENDRLRMERDSAVECIDDISYQNRKFSDNWIDEIINEWRGIDKHTGG